MTIPDAHDRQRMTVVELGPDEIGELAWMLGDREGIFECLIAWDPIDEAIKVKINSGSWSPPLGMLRKDL
jgi:hypothetical protein